MKILDIEKFIQEHKCLEVTNSFSFDREGNETDDGFYSKKIFGTNSKETSTLFGYIKLHSTIMHPAIFSMMSKVKTDFSYCLKSEKKYIIKNGMLEQSDDGKNGIGWLYTNWDQINFDNYIKENNEDIINFLKTNKNSLFINKFLVIPKKYRISSEKNGIKVEDDLTKLYKKILGKVDSGKSENEFMKEILKDNSRSSLIQKDVNIVYNYFIDQLKAKEGHFRSSLISKRIDNNTRLVANARPDIPINCCGLPWHVLLNVFDLFVVGYLRDQEIQSSNFMKDLQIENFNDVSLAEHFNYIFQNSDTYVKNNPGKREKWVQLLKEMFEYHKELRVTVKRDPAWDKGSYVALKPVIIPENAYHVVVNSQIYKPFGGDSYNTNWTTQQLQSNIIYENDDIVLKTDNDTVYSIKSTDYIYDII